MDYSDDWQLITKSHEENSNKYMALLPDTDDLSLITLKGHLIIEEILNFIIEKHCNYPKYLKDARLTFSQLICLTKALISIPMQSCAFPLVTKLNKLRNELAHNITPEKADKLATELVGLCNTDEMKGEHPLPQKVKLVICYIIGQLEVIGSVSEVVNNTPNKKIKRDC